MHQLAAEQQENFENESRISRSIFKNDAAALILLLLLTAAALLIANPSGNFPINDDRFYANAVRSIVETGVLTIEPSNAFDFIPIQLGAMVCKLFGFSYETLRFTTIAFHLFGISGLYFALKEFKLADFDAALLSSIYAFNPLLLNLSLTFMTDVPALALTNWSFFALIAGIKRQKSKFVIFSVIILSAAMSVRQTALFFLPAVIISGFLNSKNIKDRVLLLISVLIPLLAYFDLHQWFLQAQENSASYSNYSRLLFGALSIFTKPAVILTMTAKASAYFGLALAPATLLLFTKAWRKEFLKAAIISLLLSTFMVFLPLLFLHAGGSFMPYSLNLFMPPVVGSYCLIGGVPTWSAEHLKNFTYVTDFLALSFAFCIFFSIFNKGNPESSNLKEEVEELVFISSTLICAGAALVLQLSVSNFDRYYLLALSAFILCLAPAWKRLATGRIKILSLLLAIVMAAYATIAAADAMEFLRAQWQAIHRLEQSGIAAARIDGGPSHIQSLKIALFRITFRQGIGWPKRLRGGEERSDMRWWPVLSEDYIVATCDLNGYHRIAEIPYWSPLRLQSRKIFMLEANRLSSK
ncbi:MAG: glycosyltransferase family 39 protein [Candidatus Obscuribacterales bacterium]|nr:glycosyltransferase family 39 protein [Candidatus Obscuribacterales bacterium]